MASRRQSQIEDKVRRKWQDNGKWIAVAVVLGLIALGAVNYFEAQKRKAEMEAFTALFPVEKTYFKRKGAFDLGEVLKTQEAGELGIPEEMVEESRVKSGDLEADYGDVLTDLKSFLSMHPKSQAAALAGIMVLDIFQQYQAWEDALPILEQLKTRGDSLLDGLLEVSAGTVQAEAGNCNLALTHWGQVLANKSLSYLHAETSLRSGLCQEQMGRLDEAAASYRAASDKAAPGSTVASSASQFLRALEIAPATEAASEGPL